MKQRARDNRFPDRYVDVLLPVDFNGAHCLFMVFDHRDDGAGVYLQPRFLPHREFGKRRVVADLKGALSFEHGHSLRQCVLKASVSGYLPPPLSLKGF